MVLREEMYFEPRTISPGGSIRWFGATYSADPMLCHTEQTVYIRDNGKMKEKGAIILEDGGDVDCYDVQSILGVGFNVSKVDVKMLQRILKHPWSGKNYSQALWELSLIHI